jgi:hypothetical protein
MGWSDGAVAARLGKELVRHARGSSVMRRLELVAGKMANLLSRREHLMLGRRELV